MILAYHFFKLFNFAFNGYPVFLKKGQNQESPNKNPMQFW